MKCQSVNTTWLKITLFKVYENDGNTFHKENLLKLNQTGIKRGGKIQEPEKTNSDKNRRLAKLHCKNTRNLKRKSQKKIQKIALDKISKFIIMPIQTLLTI